jgi:hypothetical protein
MNEYSVPSLLFAPTVILFGALLVTGLARVFRALQRIARGNQRPA